MPLSNNTTTTDTANAMFYFIYDTALVIIVLMVTLSNSVVVAIYCYTQSIRSKPTNLLLFNQALVDLFNGAVTGGITLFNTHTPNLLTQGVYQFTIALSLHTVVLTSVERYVFIFHALFYRRGITIHRTSAIIVGSWLLSLVWIPARIVHYEDENLNWESFCWYLVVSNTIILLLMLGVGCLHWMTYKKLRGHIRQRENTLCQEFSITSKKHSRHNNCKLTEEQLAKDHKSTMRVLKIFIAMYVAFLLAWSPLFVTGVLYINNGFQPSQHDKYKFFSLDLLFYLTNSVFNPLLTLLCKKDYKKVALKLRQVMVEKVCPFITHGRRDDDDIWNVEMNDL